MPVMVDNDFHCSDQDVLVVPPVVAPLPPVDYAVELPDGLLQTPEAIIIPRETDLRPQPQPNPKPKRFVYSCCCQ